MSDNCLDDVDDILAASGSPSPSPSTSVGSRDHLSSHPASLDGTASPGYLGYNPTFSNIPSPGVAGSTPGSFLVVPNGLHPVHAASAAAHLLAIDQISLNSQSSSAYNSCPYTPINSAADEEEEYDTENRPYVGSGTRASSSSGGPPSSIPTPPTNHGGGRRLLGPRNQGKQPVDILPSFNSRDMLERIEYKRLKMKAARGWDQLASGETSPNVYPFTPKNSFVDSTFDEVYRNKETLGLDNLEPDQIAKKVEEKKRIYRLDLDEAQGMLGEIAEADDDPDLGLAGNFTFELDSHNAQVDPDAKNFPTA